LQEANEIIKDDDSNKKVAIILLHKNILYNCRKSCEIYNFAYCTV